MIKERLGIDAVLEPTNKTGQFDVMVDSQLIASRGGNVATRILFGAGFPDAPHVVDELAKRRG
jgi:hypothetical protein